MTSRAIALSFLSALILFGRIAWSAEPGQREYRDAVNATPNLAKGELIYSTCAMCHGGDGGGNGDRDVPRIAGQHKSVIIRQLVDYRLGVRWDDRMEAFADKHMLRDATEIADVAAYASRLLVLKQPQPGPGELLDKGAKTYRRRCSSCHGDDGQGRPDKTIPRLAGQQYGYLLRQLYDAADGRRPNFSAGHVRLVKRMDRDDFTSTADYLTRLP